jgi:hypothetical protein
LSTTPSQTTFGFRFAGRATGIRPGVATTKGEDVQTKHQARWVSKQRIQSLRKSGEMGRGILIDSFNGFVIVEPLGSDLGDGEPLDPVQADYELNPAWCLTPKQRLTEARRRLGL